MSEHVDLIVIGAGTAGFAAAQAARARGRSVMLVNGPGELGGTCIRRGCMPAKTLLSSTERLGDIERASHLGVRVAAERIDLRAVVARKRELVEYFARHRAIRRPRYHHDRRPTDRGECVRDRDGIAYRRAADSRIRPSHVLHE